MNYIYNLALTICVSLCVQQDVCSSHGGAGGRNRPAANSYERAQVSNCFYCLNVLYVYILYSSISRAGC